MTVTAQVEWSAGVYATGAVTVAIQGPGGVWTVVARQVRQVDSFLSSTVANGGLSRWSLERKNIIRSQCVSCDVLNQTYSQEIQ
jgi:hypothetical protein